MTEIGRARHLPRLFVDRRRDHGIDVTSEAHLRGGLNPQVRCTTRFGGMLALWEIDIGVIANVQHRNHVGIVRGLRNIIDSRNRQIDRCFHQSLTNRAFGADDEHPSGAFDLRVGECLHYHLRPDAGGVSQRQG